MPLPERGYPSPHDQCLEGVMLAIRALKLPGLADNEVQVRDEWHDGNTPHRGVSVTEAGESYDDGVISQEDIGYHCAVTIVVRNVTDARTMNNPVTNWRSNIRRRFHNQRIPVGDFGLGVRKHIGKVQAGSDRMPRLKKFAEYDITQLIVTLWVREVPDDGE